MHDNESNFLKNSLEICSHPMTMLEANQLIQNMFDKKLINEREANLLKCTISAKALNNPINIDNTLRSNIMRQVIIELSKDSKM